MAAPIRSAAEEQTIINKGQHAIGDLGLEIVRDAKLGVDNTDPDFRYKILKLVLLRAFLQNILNVDGEINNFYASSDHEKQRNNILTGILKLSGVSGGTAIPKLTGDNLPLTYYPTNNTFTTINTEASPGGITFENTNVDAPGEIIDTIDASSSNYAFYIMNIIGSGPGEGTRSCTLLVTWRGVENPTIAEYGGADVGGSTAGVTFSAAYNSGFIEITANVPTDNWTIRGSRISFYNISFQNLPPGLVPPGGLTGQLIRKKSNANYDFEFFTSVISGTVNYISKFTAEASLGNSQIFDDGINVGIGTILPSAKLDVNGNLYVRQVLSVSTIESYTGDLTIDSGPLNDLIFKTDSTIRMRINNSTGNVDILNVLNVSRIVTYSGDLIINSSSGNDIKLQTDSADRVVIKTSTGDVGIGTSSPSAKLDVNGDVKVAGKITGLTAASDPSDAVRFDQLTALTPTISGTPNLLYKVIDIGDWNMDTTLGVNVPHGISDFTKIRSVTAFIRIDDNSIYYPLDRGNALGGGVGQIGSTNIFLYKTLGGDFDNINFSATSYNRGWITIMYLA